MVLVVIIILSASLCQCRNISSEFPVLTVTGDNDNVVPTVLAPLLVSTRLGMLRGMSLKTSNERKTVSAFLGIPFARPPGMRDNFSKAPLSLWRRIYFFTSVVKLNITQNTISN